MCISDVLAAAVPCIRPNFEYLSLHKTHMIVKTDASFQGFALPHFAAEIALKPQFCNFFDALKQPGALRARDLVGRRSEAARRRRRHHNIHDDTVVAIEAAQALLPNMSDHVPVMPSKPQEDRVVVQVPKPRSNATTV